jgi:membrane protein
MSQVQSAVGPQASQFLVQILRNADRPQLASTAGVLSFLALIWGSTNVFAQLQNTLNKIWNVELKPDSNVMATFRRRLLSFALVLGVAFLLLISLVLSAVLSTVINIGQGILPGIPWIWQVVNFLVSLGVTTLLFATMYKVLPDADVSWRSVWLGAAVTALLFTIGKFILSYYLANAGNPYGAVGSVVVFLLWVFYSAQILFMGAEFTQVYARRYGEGVQPDKDAVRTADPVRDPGREAARKQIDEPGKDPKLASERH